jgi:predicted transcriptional regulator
VQVVQKLRQRHSLDILLSIAQLPRATFYYHLKQMQKDDKYASVKPANKKSSPQVDLTKENIVGSRQRKAQPQKAAANAPT